jgi:hypothetical protein
MPALRSTLFLPSVPQFTRLGGCPGAFSPKPNPRPRRLHPQAQNRTNGLCVFAGTSPVFRFFSGGTFFQTTDRAATCSSAPQASRLKTQDLFCGHLRPFALFCGDIFSHKPAVAKQPRPPLGPFAPRTLGPFFLYATICGSGFGVESRVTAALGDRFNRS